MRRRSPDYHHKQIIKKGRFIMELTIYRLNVSNYPEGVKYSMIMVEPKTKKRVLFDNHHPKGPHFHLDDKQFSYKFTTEEKLIKDFKAHVLSHLGEKI